MRETNFTFTDLKIGVRKNGDHLTRCQFLGYFCIEWYPRIENFFVVELSMAAYADKLTIVMIFGAHDVNQFTNCIDATGKDYDIWWCNRIDA